MRVWVRVRVRVSSREGECEREHEGATHPVGMQRHLAFRTWADRVLGLDLALEGWEHERV